MVSFVSLFSLISEGIGALESMLSAGFVQAPGDGHPSIVAAVFNHHPAENETAERGLSCRKVKGDLRYEYVRFDFYFDRLLPVQRASGALPFTDTWYPCSRQEGFAIITKFEGATIARWRLGCSIHAVHTRRSTQFAPDRGISN
jgi:hypothetical protein